MERIINAPYIKENQHYFVAFHEDPDSSDDSIIMITVVDREFWKEHGCANDQLVFDISKMFPAELGAYMKDNDIIAIPYKGDSDFWFREIIAIGFQVNREFLAFHDRCHGQEANKDFIAYLDQHNL